MTPPASAPLQLGSAPVGQKVRKLVMADFDGNEVPDFAASHDGFDYVAVYLGSLDGSGSPVWTPPVVLSLPPASERFGQHLAVFDVDGDTYDELFVSAIGSRKTSGKVFQYDLAGGTPVVEDTIPAPPEAAAGEFGRSVAVGNIDNDAAPELIVGAPLVKVGKSRDAGRVYAFDLPFDPQDVPNVVEDGTANSDQIGWQVATLPAGDGHDLLVTTRWNTAATRAELIRHDLMEFTLEPSGIEFTGWATAGVNGFDADADGESDWFIGAPNADCGSTNGSLGGVFFFASGAAEPYASPSVFRPDETNNGGWNAFGWSSIVIEAPSAGTSGRSFLFIGEPGREDSGGVRVGQVYVYEVTP